MKKIIFAISLMMSQLAISAPVNPAPVTGIFVGHVTVYNVNTGVTNHHRIQATSYGQCNNGINATVVSYGGYLNPNVNIQVKYCRLRTPSHA